MLEGNIEVAGERYNSIRLRKGSMNEVLSR